MAPNNAITIPMPHRTTGISHRVMKSLISASAGSHGPHHDADDRHEEGGNQQIERIEHHQS